MNIQPKATLTFSKCLEMKLDSHVDAIAKVAEVASKEFSIEQVCKFTEPLLNAMSLYQNVCGILIFQCTLCEMSFKAIKSELTEARNFFILLQR